MAKDRKSIKKDNEYNFDIFKNYVCDGQYIMEFNNDGVTIKEELTKDKDSCLLK